MMTFAGIVSNIYIININIDAQLVVNYTYRYLF